ncbi:hypothetical protein LshimejAT787_0703640 [Lyophyllum shimeji]|uniref:Uncharacterized protein n=1 Tax=Lyophyllum shimeji TaxID=47721 RepID=A0A9P3PQT1_LYOSH|nr:hypothetical protein LshimejAT787_0703640 [Lyophyllum shimeji]
MLTPNLKDTRSTWNTSFKAQFFDTTKLPGIGTVWMSLMGTTSPFTYVPGLLLDMEPLDAGSIYCNTPTAYIFLYPGPGEPHGGGLSENINRLCSLPIILS